VKYREVFLENERQHSAANFEGYDVDRLRRQFEDMEKAVPELLARTGLRARRWCCRPTTTCSRLRTCSI
jgi:glycyl-tRNA synthetase alpha chain